MAFTCEQILEWAQKYCPDLKFSKGFNDQDDEIFYPIDVDGWIRHKADESVTEEWGKDKPYGRGTTLHEWYPNSDQWIGKKPEILAGQISLDSTGIGNGKFAKRPDPQEENKDWFLNFGGWCNPDTRALGQNLYSWEVFRDLVYEELGLPTNRRPDEIHEDGCDASTEPKPDPFEINKSGLHTYAEFGSLGDIFADFSAEISLENDLQDFAENAKTIEEQARESKLTERFSLTYYFFYPGAVYCNGQGETEKIREGDWQAISLFSLDFNQGFDFASYTQGYQKPIYPIAEAACRAFHDMEVPDENHPVVYVSWGSHANYFTVRNNEIEVEDLDIPWGEIAATIFYIVGWGLCVVGIIFAAIPLLAAAAPILIGLGLILVAAAAIIAILAALLDEDPEKDFSFDKSPPEANDTHKGNGIPAGGTLTGTPENPPSSEEGKIPIIIHPISIEEKNDCLAIPWWSYVGRWGICVADDVAKHSAPTWVNSVWRKLPNGLTLTHRNVEAFIDYQAQKIDEETRTSYTYD